MSKIGNQKKTAKKKFSVVQGARVQTTDAMGRLFQPPMVKPWRGVALRPHGSMEGAWHVRVDGIPKDQVVHERYLEAES